MAQSGRIAEQLKELELRKQKQHAEAEAKKVKLNIILDKAKHADDLKKERQK